MNIRQYFIDTATGSNLDRLAENVGLVRGWQKDEIYLRRRIYSALGIPIGYVDEKLEAKPKKLTRFQILKSNA